MYDHQPHLGLQFCLIILIYFSNILPLPTFHKNCFIPSLLSQHFKLPSTSLTVRDVLTSFAMEKQAVAWEPPYCVSPSFLLARDDGPSSWQRPTSTHPAVLPGSWWSLTFFWNSILFLPTSPWHPNIVRTTEYGQPSLDLLSPSHSQLPPTPFIAKLFQGASFTPCL